MVQFGINKFTNTISLPLLKEMHEMAGSFQETETAEVSSEIKEQGTGRFREVLLRY